MMALAGGTACPKADKQWHILTGSLENRRAYAAPLAPNWVAKLTGRFSAAQRFTPRRPPQAKPSVTFGSLMTARSLTTSGEYGPGGTKPIGEVVDASQTEITVTGPQVGRR